MNESERPVKEYMLESPCRETAATLLSKTIEWHRTKLAGLEHLFKIAKNLENGSPAEEALWSILQKAHNVLYY